MTYRKVFNRYIDALVFDKDKTNQCLQHLFGQLEKEERLFIEDLLLRTLGQQVAIEEVTKHEE